MDPTTAQGMLVPGNLDPYNRPTLRNPDGSISTTSSKSFQFDRGETLIPTVVNGKRLSDAEAIAHYRKTGEHLGIFDTPANADAYAQWLHNSQANKLGLGTKPMPWNYPGGYPSPDDFFSLLQNASFQLPRQNQSTIPPNFYAPQNPVPQGALFNPMQAQGLGIGRPPGGYTGGYGNPPLPTPNPNRAQPPGLDWSALARAGLGAMVPGGGAAPGAADFARSLAATGATGQPGGVPGQAALGALQMLGGSGLVGQGAGMGAQAQGSAQALWNALQARAQAGVNPGQNGASGSWSPQTAVPPGMAQYGLSPHSGLMGALPGTGAAPGAAPYGIGPQGTGAPPPVPQQKPQPAPPLPQRKPKPKPKRQAQAGDQAQYNSKTNWQAHNEAYNPIQGNFGYQAWRTPKR